MSAPFAVSELLYRFVVIHRPDLPKWRIILVRAWMKLANPIERVLSQLLSQTSHGQSLIGSRTPPHPILRLHISKESKDRF